MLVAVELDLRPHVLAKDHHVADTHLDVLVGAHRDDLGVLGLHLGRGHPASTVANTLSLRSFEFALMAAASHGFNAQASRCQTMPGTNRQRDWSLDPSLLVLSKPPLRWLIIE